MTSDNSVEITIGALIDPSLDASTKDAIARLGDIATAARATSKEIANTAKPQTGSNPAEEQAKSWKAANEEIVRAEDSFISDIFNKRQSLGKDLLGIARSFVVEELESVAKYWTMRELYALEGVESEKASETAGFLQKLILDELGLASTAQSQAAETQAVTAGATARTAVENTASAQGLAVKAAAASTTIAQDAAQAAAGAYASVSQVPYIGWLLGPLAGAGAFAAVMAYESIASAEGGQWKVGGDEQITALHRNEMVWPGWAADGARNMLSGFARGGFDAARGDTVDRSSVTQHSWNFAPTIHGVSERDVMDELKNNAGEFLSFVRGLSRSGSMKFG